MTTEQKNNHLKAWNIFSLKEYMDFAMFSLKEKFEDDTHYLDEKFMTITKKDEEAVKTAKDSMEHRLDNLNHVYAQMHEAQDEYLKKEIFEVSHRLIEQRVDSVSRLVYIGVGICITAEIVFRFLK